MNESLDEIAKKCGKGRFCFDCKKPIDPQAQGDLRPVQHTNKRWFHADCLELFLWRKTTSVLKKERMTPGKGKAFNGRVIRSTRHLG